MAVLVIEQNIGVATAVSENVAIMVNGRVNRIIDSARLAADRDLQQRLLGVGLPRRHRGRSSKPARRRQQAGGAPQPARSKAAGADLSSPTRRCRRAGRSRCRSRASRPPRAPSRPASRDSTRSPRQRREPVATPDVRTAGRAGRRHARHQGRGAALHPRHHRRQRPAHPRWSISRPAARLPTCDVSAQEIALNHGRGGSSGVRRRPRRIGDGDGGGLRKLAAPPGRCRRHHLAPAARAARRWSHPACARCRRRAEDDGLDRRLRRRRPLCRPCRHHDDVFGHRRAGPQLDLARRCSPTAPTRWPAWSRRASRRDAPATRRAARAFPPSASPCSASPRLRAADRGRLCATSSTAWCSTPPASAASRWRSWSTPGSSPA